MKSKKYIKNTVAVITATLLSQTLVMSNNIFNMQASAEENTVQADNQTYKFSLTPINSELATKSGNSKIRIKAGDAESFSLSANELPNVSSYTMDYSSLGPGFNWLFLILKSDNYGTFNVPINEVKVEGSTICIKVGKGTQSYFNNNNNVKNKYQIEFLDDVVFKYQINYLGTTDELNNSDDSDEDAGWKMVNNIWYYYKTDTEVGTGWVKYSGKWYYLNQDGSMKTGWLEDSGKWYYLKQDGSMAHDTSIGGYNLDSNGVWV